MADCGSLGLCYEHGALIFGAGLFVRLPSTFRTKIVSRSCGRPVHRSIGDRMRPRRALSYSAAFETFTTGGRLELRPMRRKERPRITDVRRTLKKPSRKFI